MKMKNPVLTSLTISCLLFTLLLVGYKASVKANPDIIYVPSNYPTIQEAINHANSGYTIYVKAGTYYEHVVIDKSVSLTGEDRDSTIIDGGGTGSVISVTTNNVNINSFTIQNSGSTESDSGIYAISSGNNISHNTITDNKNGIYLHYSSNNTISDNNSSSNNWYGIYLHYSSNNMVSSNNIYSNYNDGIYLYYSSSNTICGNNIYSNNNGIHLYNSSNNRISHNNASNTDCGIWISQLSSNNMVSDNKASNNNCGIYLYYSSNNTISNNKASNNENGIYVHSSSNDNTIYHNNFINNIDQVWSDSVNIWDDSNEGNYWSDYPGQDLNGDGIGDTPYVIDANNQDSHPLIGIFSNFHITWKHKTYSATTICNSTISNFRFEIRRDTGNKIISFDVTGKDDTVGFCRIMIPTELMNYPYIILVDEEEIIQTYLDVSNKTHVHLYFTYVPSSHITIISSKLLYLYSELLDKYGALLGNYSQLLETYSTLNTSYQQLLLDYSELRDNGTALLWEHAQNIQNLTYVFIATTAIFIIAAVYLSTHAHRRVSRN